MQRQRSGISQMNPTLLSCGGGISCLPHRSHTRTQWLLIRRLTIMLAIPRLPRVREPIGLRRLARPQNFTPSCYWLRMPGRDRLMEQLVHQGLNAPLKEKLTRLAGRKKTDLDKARALDPYFLQVSKNEEHECFETQFCGTMTVLLPLGNATSRLHSCEVLYGCLRCRARCLQECFHTPQGKQWNVSLDSGRLFEFSAFGVVYFVHGFNRRIGITRKYLNF